MTSQEMSGKRLPHLRSTSPIGCLHTWVWLTRSLITRSFCSVVKVQRLSTSSMDASFSMLKRWRFVREAALWILVRSWTHLWYSIHVFLPMEMTSMCTSTTFLSKDGQSFLNQASSCPSSETTWLSSSSELACSPFWWWISWMYSAVAQLRR